LFERSRKKREVKGRKKKAESWKRGGVTYGWEKIGPERVTILDRKKGGGQILGKGADTLGKLGLRKKEQKKKSPPTHPVRKR